jgi:hypothetical protein
MRRSGNFQAPTDDSAVQSRDDRHSPVLDPVESLMCDPRQVEGGHAVGRRDEGQIGPGAKMAAFSMHDDRPRSFRRRAEDCLDAGDHLAIDGVTLGRPRQPHKSHGTTLTDGNAVRQVERCSIGAVSFFPRSAEMPHSL